MKGFHTNIEKQTLDNPNFRKVIFTGNHSQLVLMTLQPNEEIGMEVHNENDQFFRFESGEGKVIVEGDEFDVSEGDAVVIPSGTSHNVINTSAENPLKLYTLYSPAHHPDGTIHATKEDAEKADHT
jgi:mannose-6-phosphate isomerase-like protein (cupin superfamily)